MSSLEQQVEDYRRIEKAIRYIEENFKAQLSLDELAEAVHLSKYHFDRLFKRWAGVSPIQFQQYLTLEYTKDKLSQAHTLFETALDSGLSGSSRLHDLFVTYEAMTPGEYKNQADGVIIDYGFSTTPFGQVLLATTKRGICFLGFVNDDIKITIEKLRHTWPGAMFNENTKHSSKIIKTLFSHDTKRDNRPFNLLLKGTNFQTKVWRALLEIPEGFVASYQDVATFIGQPQAVRAVAGAIAVNPIAYLIPCHRVIAKTGRIHNYRWGKERKQALIGWEAVQVSS